MALRLAQLITLFLSLSISWILLIPHFENVDPVSWLELPDYEELKPRTRKAFIRINGRRYEVITNTIMNPVDCTSTELFDEFFLRKGMQLNRHLAKDLRMDVARAVDDHRYRDLRHKLHEARRKIDYEKDGLRNKVRETLPLRGRSHD